MHQTHIIVSSTFEPSLFWGASSAHLAHCVRCHSVRTIYLNDLQTAHRVVRLRGRTGRPNNLVHLEHTLLGNPLCVTAPHRRLRSIAARPLCDGFASPDEPPPGVPSALAADDAAATGPLLLLPDVAAAAGCSAPVASRSAYAKHDTGTRLAYDPSSMRGVPAAGG